MTFEAALGIINNAAFLVTLVVLYSFSPLPKKPVSRASEVVLGSVLGLTGVAVMLNSWSLAPGIFFDTRSILLSTTGLFFGALPAVIAAAITATFRVVNGGSGAAMGVMVILTSAAWGVAWRRLRFSPTRAFGWFDLWCFGLVVHFTMVACVMFLPSGVRLSILEGIGPLILGIYPVATMLMGKLLDSQRTRHVAFEETRRNERWLRRLFERAWGITSLVDSEGRVIYISESIGPILGYSPKEMMQRNFDCFTHPDDREEARRKFARLTRTAGAVDTIEHRIRHQDGRWLWVETVATNLTSDPDIRAVVFNTRDTSDRKSKEKIHGAVLEGAHEGFLATSIDTRLLEVNRAFCQMVGYTQEELASLSVADIEAIESPEQIFQRRDRLLETGGLGSNRSSVTKTVRISMSKLASPTTT